MHICTIHAVSWHAWSWKWDKWLNQAVAFNFCTFKFDRFLFSVAFGLRVAQWGRYLYFNFDLTIFSNLMVTSRVYVFLSVWKCYYTKRTHNIFIWIPEQITLYSCNIVNKFFFTQIYRVYLNIYRHHQNVLNCWVFRSHLIFFPCLLWQVGFFLFHFFQKIHNNNKFYMEAATCIIISFYF